MTLVLRKDGTYEADVTHAGTRVHLSLRTTRKREAETRHQAVLALVKHGPAEVLAAVRRRRLSLEVVAAAFEAGRGFAGLLPDTTPTVAPWPTLAEAIREYLADAEANPRRAAGTVRRATRSLGIVAAALGADTPVDQITPDAAERWAQQLVATPDRSLWALVQPLIYGRALYAWLAKREAKRAHRERRGPRPLPCPIEAEWIPPRPDGRTRFLTAAEVQALVRETPPSFLAAVGLGLYAGLRAGEVQALRVEDLAGDVVHVRSKPHWDARQKKPWRPKSGKPRSVVVGPWLARVLATQAATVGTGWLFPAPRTAAPRDTEWFRRQFRAICDRAGLPYGLANDQVTYHTLRHTFAAHHVMSGTDLFTLSELLGHADLRMLKRTYGHLSPDHRAQTAARLEAALAPETAPDLPRIHTGGRAV